MRPEPKEPRTTSASQLTTYSMCPRKYFLSYVLGRPAEFKSLALIMGSAIHSAIGWWFGEKLDKRTPTLEGVDRIAEADLLASTIDDVTIRWKEMTLESLVDDAKRFLRAYLGEYGDLPVKTIEAPFRVPLADPETGAVLGRDLKGFFDLVLEDDRIVEIKTAARGWREDDLARHLQAGAYAFASMGDGNRSEIEVHVLVKLKRVPRVERYVIGRGRADVRWWLRAAASIEEAIAAGHFPPSPSMLCGECEHQHACLGMTDPLTDEPAESEVQVLHDATPANISYEVPRAEIAV